MACANINDLYVAESGRFGLGIYQRLLATSPWMSRVEQEPFPAGMGDNLTAITWERNLPTDEPTWQNVGNSTGDDPGSCDITPVELPTGQTKRQYGIQAMAIRTPFMCINDLFWAWQVKEQTKAAVVNLTQNTQWYWKERARDEYTRIAAHKTIVTTGLPEDPTNFPTTAPTSQLTDGVLQTAYIALVQDGAAMTPSGPVATAAGKPIFMLITSMEQGRQLLKGDDNTRQDFRWSTRADELLAPVSMEASYNGFLHSYDPYPVRWNLTMGVWVRVLPFIQTAASQGFKIIPNPAWKTALYEDSYIYVPCVYKTQVPNVNMDFGGGIVYNAQNYRGEFQWINNKDNDCNPLGNKGYFRGDFYSASKPEYPEFGYVFRHLRCDIAPHFVACS